MLLRDLAFSEDHQTYWAYAQCRGILVATPGSANTVRSKGSYWIKKPGESGDRPESWHHDLSEFEAQAVLDNYLQLRGVTDEAL